jgi:hypothetical protein
MYSGIQIPTFAFMCYPFNDSRKCIRHSLTIRRFAVLL